VPLACPRVRTHKREIEKEKGKSSDKGQEMEMIKEKAVEQIRRYFPKARGKARVDDRRVISGIVYVLRNGLRWRDAPKEYGPYKTLYNRFIRWSKGGVFAKILQKLAKGGRKVLMMDATHLKAHRTVASLREGGLRHERSDARREGLAVNYTLSAMLLGGQ
jgi:transposase